MLYQLPEDGKRYTLHEDALQAYLQCRLDDLLAGRVLENPVKVAAVDREVQVAYRSRFDLKVKAPKLGGGLATCILEVKWSHNDTMATALSGQLKPYLTENEYSCGIYLVGWDGVLGSWPETLGSPPGTANPEWLTEQLATQAKRCEEQNPGLRIHPIVLDFCWNRTAERS
ncbi:MAG: hypothetical protein ACOC7S_01675 [Planctomycetota bacterium]